MTNTKSTFVRKIKRMSRKAPVRIVAVVLAVLLVMNVTSILTNLSVFAQTQEDYAVIGIEMNGKTSVVEYRAKDDCSLVVAVYDDDGAKMLGSGNTTVTVDKQSAEVEISIDEMPQYYLVKAFLVNPVNNYPLCDAFVNEDYTEENNQVTLSNLQSDEEYFVCGKDNVITFTVNVTGSPDSVKLYKNNTDLVGEMHDDGLNGDETAGDGKYTCVINEKESVNKTTAIRFFAESEDVDSNEKFLYFFEELTEESKEVIINTTTHIEEIKSDFVDENGCIEIDELGTVISTVSEYIKQLSDEEIILWYEVNEDNIIIRFVSGFLMTFIPNIKDFKSGDKSNISIHTFQPCEDFVSSNKYDDVAELITKHISNYTFSNDLDTQQVTLDSVRENFKNDSVIFWDGHGGYSKKYHSFLLTGENYDLNQLTTNFNGIDNIQGAVIPTSDGGVVFTSIFIDRYCTSMRNSYFWLGACHSGQDSVLANSLLRKGASSVIGYSNSVICGYDYALFESVGLHMLEINNNTHNYNTIGESLELAKREYGESDTKMWSNKGAKGARPVLFPQNSSYRFTNAGTLSGTICKDTNNATIPDAEIYISDLNNKAMLSGCMKISNSKGKFTAYLPSGNYTITVHASGYSWNRTTAIVKENQTTNVTVKLTESTGNEECPWDDLPDDDDGNEEDPVPTIIETGKCGDNITYTLYENGLLLLSGSGNMYDYSYGLDVPWYSNRTKITQVKFIGNISSIGNNAFNDCSSLKSISIPNSVTQIGWGAFQSCSSLTNIAIPSSITEIKTDTFSCCSKLTTVTIPNSVISIGNFAFEYCNCLKSIVIPNSVKSIGDYAFWKCTSLTNITIPDSVTEIGTCAFVDSGLKSIMIPYSVVNIGAGAFGRCKNLTNISVAEENNYFTSFEGIIYNKDRTLLIACPRGKKTKVTIPNSVSTIGECAFLECDNLTSITIPDSVTAIGDYAFSDCTSLINIEIPDSVTTLGGNAFEWCSQLSNILIPNSVVSIKEGTFSNCRSLRNITIPDSVTSVGENAFFQCISLTNITISNSVTSIGRSAFQTCTNLTDITIPNSVTSIEAYTFKNCTNLTSLTISKYVTSIDGQAFNGCTSLTEVYYTGTQEEWQNISIGNYNIPLTNATIYYNSTGPSSSPTPMHSPDVSGTLSATFDNLIPNANYLFVVSKSSDLDNMLDASNLLFIDEKTVGDSGSLTFGYIPREDYEGTVVKIFGPVNPSVTLNTTSATLKKGEKLTLTATVDQGHSANDVEWSSSNEKIATVVKGQVKAVSFGDAEISARLDDCVVKCVVSVVPDLDFTILGASIRLSEPYGIRFGIQLGKGGDYANVKIVEYGTLMKPTQLLGDEELTLQTAKIQKIPAKVIYSETDAAQVYTGVLINIPTTYFDTAISGCGYFIYEDENGVNHTIYTDTVSMSFNDVVEAAYNKYSKLTNPTDAQKVVLQKLEKLRALNGNN